MTHYCPVCRRRMPQNPAEAHHCPPDPQTLIVGPPSPRAAQRRRDIADALSEGLCHAAVTVALIGILWGWIGYGCPLP